MPDDTTNDARLHGTKGQLLNRLHRVEGQVRGIERIVVRRRG